MQICKIAASAAGNQDLLPDALGVFKHNNATSAPPRLDGAQEPRSSATYHNCIKVLIHTRSQDSAIILTVTEFRAALKSCNFRLAL